jgi:hypothetical protein
MCADENSGPRKGWAKEWPDDIKETLERVGITPNETVGSIGPKIRALGFEIRDTHIDHGGIIPTYPLYYAAVADPNDEDGILGQYWSSTGYAEALAWATARVLVERDMKARRLQEHLESSDPNEYILPEFGPTCDAAPGLDGRPLYPEDPEIAIAEVFVGDEKIVHISMPYARQIGRWSDEQEQQLQQAVGDLAQTCDLKNRKGILTLVIEPGKPGEIRETVDRPDALNQP